MHLMYFTEQPMSAYDAKEGLKYGATALTFSNKHFDPVAGSRLYGEYLEQYIYAEEVGVDGIMLNEHHNAPFCMQAKANIFAAVLAGATKRVKIVMLGNPLPLAENPIRLAEELAMIDMISKGRLVSGFVRGGGQEQLATGVNPAFNRERFEEAHDLIVKTWTVHGPFRWEGTHYQHRVVNPWALPLQKPYPRVWIPGVISKETIIWAAKQRYPYIALNTSIAQTKSIWKLYDETAAAVGYKSGPENRGYLARIHVAETEEKAVQNAKQFMWMQGEFTGLAHPGVGQSVGVFLAERAAKFRRVRGGPGQEPARQPHLRGAARRRHDHVRDARAGAAAHPPPAGRDAAGHPGGMGQRRQCLATGFHDLHPPARPGGVSAGARVGKRAGSRQPVRGRRAGQHRLCEGFAAAGGGRRVSDTPARHGRSCRRPPRRD